jgi:LEA14-like dessication related protein
MTDVRKGLMAWAALMIIIATAACSQPKSLVYQELRSFRVQQVDLQQATIVLDLKFYNPNNYSLSLKNGDLDAWLNNRYLGKATLDERTTIPARDTFLLPVSVTADLKNIVSNAFELLSSQDKDMLVRLQGTIRAGKAGVFIGVPVRYEGQQRIRL